MKKITSKTLLLAAISASFMSSAFAMKFNELPLGEAIKIVNGNGARKIAVFSDPYCPHSQAYQKSLAQIPDVTIYVFPTPINPGSEHVAQNIVCSSSPGATWTNWMLTGNEPRSSQCGQNANFTSLYSNAGGRGTPFSILENSSVIHGNAPAEDLNKRLSFASRKATNDAQSARQQAPAQAAPIVRQDPQRENTPKSFSPSSFF